jgi:SAM-dependent methyltransferase
MHPAGPCPLCATPDAPPFHQDPGRDYFRCGTCQLIFVPTSQLPSPEEEKAQYDLHRNHPDDPGYRAFLGRLHDPLRQRLLPGSHGLDFGSGPGPTLSVMFEEDGHTMAIYDPFYASDPVAFDRTYDFITATEVLEHLHHPAHELVRLWDCLKPGGWLGVMTKLALDRERFARWHYRLDPTHVRFYSRHTFEWLASQWNATLTFVADDALLLRKP